MLSIKASGTKEVPVQQTKTVNERPFSIVLTTRRDCEAFIVLMNALAYHGTVGPADSEAVSRARELGSSIGRLIEGDGHLPRKTQLTPAARKYFGLA